MKRLLAILPACAGILAAAGMQAGPPAPDVGHFLLRIDGDPLYVLAASGSGLRTQVSELPGSSSYPAKTPTGSDTEAVEIQVPVPVPEPLAGWIRKSLAGTFERKTVSVQWLDPAGTIRETRILEDTTLSRVRLDPIDARGTDIPLMHVTLLPARVRLERPEAGVVTRSPQRTDPVIGWNVRISLGGLPTDLISRVVGLQIDTLPPDRHPVLPRPRARVSNFELEIPIEHWDAWSQWFHATISGQPAQEVSGAIVFLDQTGTERARLGLENVGLVRLALPAAVGTPQAGTFEVELYAEHVDLSQGTPDDGT